MTRLPRVRPPRATGETGLGTFGGVFTPSILTILGVIMYLRFGWVVGQAGVAGTLIIVTIATAITFLTALSISQIATDQRVRAGGAYYMISRALGLEIGGAIGYPLYLAQALSVALYTVGFAESVVAVFPSLSQRWVAVATTVVVAGIGVASAKIAIRAQYFIMAGIAVSLVAFFFGSPVEASTAVDTVERVGFWVVFAVFFPAVTGIMAGVNMSGDLADARRSIPRGTLAAVGVSYAIYMLIPTVLAGRADEVTLLTDPLVMRRIAFWGDSVLIGVWGATLSSALGSILGAPRILQALARDGIVPRPLRWLGHGVGAADEPRMGTVVTLGLALVAVALGDLDVIAPILTMFFLTTYAVVNLVSAAERFLKSPSFRPTFRVHWVLSLVGALGCIWVMFLINGGATIAAFAIVAAIYFVLQRRELRTTWGDVRQGIWQAMVRWGLLNLRAASDPKNWRPHLLVLAGNPAKRWYLIDLANAIAHDRAIINVAAVLPEGSVTPERRKALTATLREHLEERGVAALLRVISAPSPYAGASLLVEAYGLGSLVPNTILLGDKEGSDDRAEYCAMLSDMFGDKRNLIVVRADEHRGFGTRRRIDVWWQGVRGNGSLMLTLAHLLGSSLYWRDAEVNINMIIKDPEGVDETRSNLTALIRRSRMDVRINVLTTLGDPFETIVAKSGGADLVMMGLPNPQLLDDLEDFEERYTSILERTAALNAVAYVLAAEEIDFHDILL